MQNIIMNYEQLEKIFTAKRKKLDPYGWKTVEGYILIVKYKDVNLESIPLSDTEYEGLNELVEIDNLMER